MQLFSLLFVIYWFYIRLKAFWWLQERCKYHFSFNWLNTVLNIFHWEFSLRANIVEREVVSYYLSINCRESAQESLSVYTLCIVALRRMRACGCRLSTMARSTARDGPTWWASCAHGLDPSLLELLNKLVERRQFFCLNQRKLVDEVNKVLKASVQMSLSW